MYYFKDPKFFKAHALGNDLILIQYENIDAINHDFICKLINRFCGIGCNQLLAVDNENNVKIWNEDGTIADLCGNGLRCLGKLLNQPKITLNTASGPVILENLNNGLVKMKIKKQPVINSIDENSYYVDVGNKHQIYFVEDSDKVNLLDYMNDEIIHSFLSQENGQWKIRTMECNSPVITLACGSAALASAYTLNYKKEPNLNVNFKLGSIDHSITNTSENNDILLTQTGPATIVAELKLTQEFLSTFLTQA